MASIALSGSEMKAYIEDCDEHICDNHNPI